MSKLKKSSKILKTCACCKIDPNILDFNRSCYRVSSIRFVLDSKMGDICLLHINSYNYRRLDGRIARMLNATSHFGAELDSLCDFANFGICPAFYYIFMVFFQQYEYKVTSGQP